MLARKRIVTRPLDIRIALLPERERAVAIGRAARWGENHITLAAYRKARRENEAA